MTIRFWLLTAVLAAWVPVCLAEMPQWVNDELVSAYRTDLVGPEVWTGRTQGPGHSSQNGTAESYWAGEVPFELIGKPKPGLSGLLHVVHEVRGLVDALVPVLREGTVPVSLVPIRNRWTPAGMTTYYRGCPTGVSETEGCHVGATVVKERKAILTNNTFVAELTVKNTGPVPRRYTLKLKTAGGLPRVGDAARAWAFSTCSMNRLVERVTYVCAKGAFGGNSVELEIPAHGEATVRYALVLGKTDEAAALKAKAEGYLDVIRTRHWDAKLGLFLAADPETYRLADKSACYDSFAPYLWGLVTEPEYLRAFEKFTDRAWFWDDFPATTCAKSCPMYNGANGIVTPPAATPDKPVAKGCCWNGPMWHYANGLYAAAFGQAARVKADLRTKWVEFFDAWSESHWTYGDRTAPRASEHFRPEDGARCGFAWDYFHSAWLNPFYLYRCGIAVSDDLRTLAFDPFADEDFRLARVPLAGREYAFEQHVRASGERALVVSLCEPDGTERVLAKGKGALRVAIEPREVPFAVVPPAAGTAIPKPPAVSSPKVTVSFANGRENPGILLGERDPISSGDATAPVFSVSTLFHDGVEAGADA